MASDRRHLEKQVVFFSSKEDKSEGKGNNMQSCHKKQKYLLMPVGSQRNEIILNFGKDL